jgi:hypothetical protein
LSIAVFGPPGSGKNFTVTQILSTVDPDLVKNPLEFNVSQFKDLDDLTNAFHQAQDLGLQKKVPLLVFDEFDTNHEESDFGWLKYFLAPMQDGHFKGGESMHRIGRAIFVFAGGVCGSFEAFVKHGQEEKNKKAKLPDFMSRLRGYLNISSINPEEKRPVDGLLLFRRAVLLNSFLQAHLKEIFDKHTNEAGIDDDVLRAFLHVPEYKHGARSMEALMQMAKVTPRKRFEKASFALKEQLQMHVDVKEFSKFLDYNPQEFVTEILEKEKIIFLPAAEWKVFVKAVFEMLDGKRMKKEDFGRTTGEIKGIGGESKEKREKIDGGIAQLRKSRYLHEDGGEVWGDPNIKDLVGLHTKVCQWIIDWYVDKGHHRCLVESALERAGLHLKGLNQDS